MDFFNKDWKEYIGSGDKVLATERTNSGVITAFSLCWAFLISVFNGFIWIGEFAKLFGMPVAALSILTIVVFAAVFAVVSWRAKSYIFIIAQNGVYQVGGLVFKQAKFVPYHKITDAILKRNLWDLLFGTGTIGISTAGGTRSTNGSSQPYEVHIRSVGEYKKIRESVYKNMK